MTTVQLFVNVLKVVDGGSATIDFFTGQPQHRLCSIQALLWTLKCAWGKLSICRSVSTGHIGGGTGHLSLVVTEDVDTGDNARK